MEAVYGTDPLSGKRVCPLRELWGLEAKEKLSPVLSEKLCRTATATFSYERAAEVAQTWGVPMDDSTLHDCVRRKGRRAEAQCEKRVERALSVETRAEVVAEAKKSVPRGEFSLVLMLDGWMARERGEHWGLKPRGFDAKRVEWHEMKAGIVFRLDQRAETQSGRRVILEKFYVCSRGDPYEVGCRLYAEALRDGLVQAKHVYVVADGGVWIWNVFEDRFPDATGVLDFYHASQHLWAVAHELYGEGSEQARQWVEPLLHQLKHGGEAGVLKTLEDLLELCGQMEEQTACTVKREVKYLHSHRDHIHYRAAESQNCPNGSGAMESTCSQFQDRFKRTGQFWTIPGKRDLMALELARRNGDWDEIWEVAAGPS